MSQRLHTTGLLAMSLAERRMNEMQPMGKEKNFVNVVTIGPCETPPQNTKMNRILR